MNYKKGKNLSDMTKSTRDKFTRLSVKGKVASVMLTSAILGLLTWLLINFADAILTIFMLLILLIIMAIANGYGQKTLVSNEILEMKAGFLNRLIGEVLQDRFDKTTDIGSEPPRGQYVNADENNILFQYLLPSTHTLLPERERIELATELKNRICNKLYNNRSADLFDSKKSIMVQIYKNHIDGLMLVKIAVSKDFIYRLNI